MKSIAELSDKSGNFNKIDRELEKFVDSHPKLKANSKLLFKLLLRLKHTKSKSVYITNSFIKKALNIDIKTANTSLKQLEDLKFILLEKQEESTYKQGNLVKIAIRRYYIFPNTITNFDNKLIKRTKPARKTKFPRTENIHPKQIQDDSNTFTNKLVKDIPSNFDEAKPLIENREILMKRCKIKGLGVTRVTRQFKEILYKYHLNTKKYLFFNFIKKQFKKDLYKVYKLGEFIDNNNSLNDLDESLLHCSQQYRIGVIFNWLNNVMLEASAYQNNDIYNAETILEDKFVKISDSLSHSFKQAFTNEKTNKKYLETINETIKNKFSVAEIFNGARGKDILIGIQEHLGSQANPYIKGVQDVFNSLKFVDNRLSAKLENKLGNLLNCQLP